ncbi:MAG: type II toxin-antitoxin system prevent-host-death family antitoxin [Defluviitaleaceae bacterium]|nr:type II toxin-antitoxin system prevent-host-death family antitoxin [Defluviitaleaceae bacterium]
MPTIRSSTDLRNNYNDISNFCHQSREPIFITKNGQGDLAVMSIELYEMLNNRLELYHLLAEGRADVSAGRVRPLDEVMQDLRKQVQEYANG